MARFPRGMWLLCAIPFALQGCGGGGGTEPGPAPIRPQGLRRSRSMPRAVTIVFGALT